MEKQEQFPLVQTARWRSVREGVEAGPRRTIEDGELRRLEGFMLKLLVREG